METNELMTILNGYFGWNKARMKCKNYLQGNSDTPEQIALLQKFINRFGKNRITGILADREFIGVVPK